MAELLVVLSTCPDAVVAKRIAQSLVDERLVACVNIIQGIESVYTWKGKTEEEEVLLVMKTVGSRFAELEQRITTLHPYDTPEIVALNAAAVSEPYLAWTKQQTN